MCGINGFTWSDEKLIMDMNSVTKYRGPDDEGVFINDDVSLGHSRLSIIDLSPAGHQPMSNEDGSLWITYNGEVYNAQDLKNDLVSKEHVFKSRSDTEIIIHAFEEYGPECLHKFNGMWAFCIYNKKTEKLFIARDRFGVKPLYYHYDGAKLIFSSMPTAILKHGIKRAPDAKSVMQYLAFNTLHHCEATFFEGISSLLPGHYMEFDLKSRNLKITQWYFLEDRNESVSKDDIRSLFEKSVSLRTVSDVPVGSCLSGGVDSTAIVCLLNKHIKEQFGTYSLIVPGHRLDESKYIKETGRLTNTRQFFTTIEEDDFLGDIDDFVSAHEEPVSSLSVYAQYKVMKLAHENGAKVLLDGQGGDEIFAGYPFYFSNYFYGLLKEMRLIEFCRQNFAYIKHCRNIYPQSFLAFQFLPDTVKRMIFRKKLNPWINHDLTKKLCGNELEPRWPLRDLKSSLKQSLFGIRIPHLLRWEDKNSMRWSVESRVPFLDYKLVEAAFSLPDEAKIKNGSTKVMFKDAVADILPDMIRNRRDKTGFGTSDNEFFRNERISAFCKDIIYSKEFMEQPYWNWPGLERSYKKFLSGELNIGIDVMKWISTGLWLKKYF